MFYAHKTLAVLYDFLTQIFVINPESKRKENLIIKFDKQERNEKLEQNIQEIECR